ncbi:hypothetical protein D9M69_309690 [compost metagenome]
MIAAIPTSTATCLPKAASATVPRVITMISAERMKSVRIAPLILSFSMATRSTAGLATASASSAWCCSSSSALCSHLCASFSKPSKQRKAPPSISSGITAQGAKALISNAAGTRMALFTIEPLATAQTTGSSRSALTPLTCWAFSARSSPSTPAVFFAATLVITETSSSRVAMSSIRVSRLAPAMVGPCRGDSGRCGSAQANYRQKRPAGQPGGAFLPEGWRSPLTTSRSAPLALGLIRLKSISALGW